MEQTPNQTSAPAVELMDRDATCRFFGGNRPINPATLYRGMRTSVYPHPIKVGANSSRWIRSECVAALAKIIAERDGQPAQAA